MKLDIEYVPPTLRYSSFYRVFTRGEWERMRDDMEKESLGRCQICGDKGDLNLDPMWVYDDEKHVQRLEGLVLLCRMCHYARHFGIATRLVDAGMLDYYELVEHVCKANSYSRKEFEKHKREALETWQERSQYKWKRDLSRYHRQKRQAVA